LLAIQAFSLKLPPSYDGKDEFIDAINQLPDFSAANPVQLVQFHKDECFDSLCVLQFCRSSKIMPKFCGTTRIEQDSQLTLQEVD
jgi:hypothetical protein